MADEMKVVWVNATKKKLEKELNKLTGQGWEVVNIGPTQHYGLGLKNQITLKRPKK